MEAGLPREDPMNHLLVAFVAILVTVVPLAAQEGGDRSISVSGHAEVRVPPDEVLIALGIETYSADLEQAKVENDSRVAAVLTAAYEAGARKEDVHADFISIFPEYGSRNNEAVFL